MIIGLTGGSGTGKSAIANFLKTKNFEIIDLDKVSRIICDKDSKCLKEIVSFFGEIILNEDKSLNRRLLGEIVFSNSEKLTVLNNITHKYILEKTLELIFSNKDKNIVLDAPLLFQSGLDKYCDKTISVISDENIRVSRIIKRDNISKEVAINRINSQPKNDFYFEKSDFIIENNESIELLNLKINEILQKISGL